MSTILIADDEARIRRLVSDFLKRDGHTIVEAADGKEALNILENRRPGLDMAILDVMMPGMDGFEVLRELREQEHGETHLPVMLLTARLSTSRTIVRLRCRARVSSMQSGVTITSATCVPWIRTLKSCAPSSVSAAP